MEIVSKILDVDRTVREIASKIDLPVFVVHANKQFPLIPRMCRPLFFVQHF